ncbi:hypothetical protein ACFQU9_17305 [Actinomadura namibiensis]|uniref:Uncharacterized protein n=1 Tax=Actinomadura namibiensis TaxID=182080 RepID=A0A7W3LRR8_ACTNM|nr:hypothetical protein [Actinomadura namibiensis]MBA8953088.1 hypothetical protein [Actinomadura namibiensis]
MRRFIRPGGGTLLLLPRRPAVVEHGPLDGFQVDRAQEIGDLARHVQDDWQLGGRGVGAAGGGVGGRQIGDSGAADAVLTGQIAAPRLGPGRPRTRPVHLVADKDYSRDLQPGDPPKRRPGPQPDPPRLCGRTPAGLRR